MATPLKDLLTEIGQVGIVVENIDNVRTIMKEMFGADPSRDGEYRHGHPEYRGNPGNFSCKMLHYNFANIELEFIEPDHADSVWRDHLNKHGNSIHHILFNVRSCDEVRDAFAEHDIPVAQKGDSVRGNGQYWSYYELEKLGLVAEIVSGRSLKKN